MIKQKIGNGVTRYLFDSHEEWLAGREGVGGSDAASILGLSPYKNNQQLWREKTGSAEPEDISGKPYVQYGIKAEPIIRNLFALNHPDLTVQYYGDNLIRNDAYPWAHASLDGEITDVEGRKGIWEGKTATIVKVDQTVDWDGRIPIHYYTQVLHYLLVTGYDFVWLTALLRYVVGDKKIEIRDYCIEREDVKKDIDFLKTKEEEFWMSINDNREPGLILPEP